MSASTSNNSSDHSFLKCAIDGSATAIMMVDRDLNITYVNEATKALISRHLQTFRTAYPDIDPEHLVGKNIDRFHKDPSHQRRLLSKAQNLPHTATVKLGDVEFRLSISAMVNRDGDYIGSALEWADVTDLRAKERLNADYAGQIAAIHKSQAVIEFNLDGTIVHANDNFLRTMGYRLDEVVGEHHRMFVAPEDCNDPAYTAFWDRLRRGEFAGGEYKRIGKDGREVWIQATYNPIRSVDGKLIKVVKYASDVTDQKLQTADYQGQIDAISKAQAVIEFKLDGTVITANQNFLDAVGYSLEEIRGRHHSMFVSDEHRRSPEYANFWAQLRNGQFDAGEYKRIDKQGRDVWIKASYNPIFDMNGKPFKVVKYAVVVTDEKLKNAESAGQIAAIDKAQGVIHFDMSGRVLWANGNFLDLMGYTADEVVGRHHSTFVDTTEANGTAYREFWEKLNRGEFDAGEYKRFARDGREVWIQATYNPILDPEGNPFKVVKFASDITARVRLQQEVQEVVSETVRVANALADGDVRQQMRGDFHGRFGDLKDAFNAFIVSTAETLHKTKNASISVSEATVQLRTSSRHLADGAAEQQKACQVASEALVETSAMVESTATNAGRANDLVHKAAEAANAGGQKMQNMTEAMSDISVSSTEMSKIIKVIDEIAFQTNLLAVNAAVEAARAGRHGRGFAVVAQEVRSLAGRSAKAAQATAELIEKSSMTVSRGVDNVEQTSASLEEIRDSVLKVRDIVAEISEASGEQNRGLAEVRHSMDEVNTSASGASQQSAQLAAAAATLAQQSDVLEGAVGKFKLPETAGITQQDHQLVEKFAALLGVDPASLSAIVAGRGARECERPEEADTGAVLSEPTSGNDGNYDGRGFGSF